MKLFESRKKEVVLDTMEEDNFQKKKRAGIPVKRLGGFIKRHRKLFVFLIVLILIVSGVLVFLNERKKSTPENQGATISTEEIEKRTLSNSISITGTIASADSESVTANISDVEILSVGVEVGDYVQAGQTICTLDSSDLEADLSTEQQNRNVAVTKASMSVESAERSLAEVQTEAGVDITRNQENINDACEDYTSAVDEKNEAYNNYELAKSETASKQESYDKAKSTLKTLKKALEDAQAALEAVDTAVSENEATGTDLQSAIEDARAAYDAQVLVVDKAKTALATAESAEEKAKSTYDSAVDSVSSKVDAYEKAVDTQEDANRSNTSSILNKQDSVKSAKLEASTSTDSEDDKIEELEDKIQRCTITAPISGVVTSVSAVAGENYDAGEICVIQDDSSFIVEATVDQYDISNVSQNMVAVIKTDATGDLEMQGTVTFVSPTPKTSSSSSTGSGSGTSSSSSSSTEYPIEIKISTKDDRLRIGMTAETSILVESAENVLSVPYDCIETNADGESVIYIVEDSALKGQTSSGNSMPKKPSGEEMPSNKRAVVVKTGLETDYYTEIISDDIEEGMMVLVPNTVTTESTESEKTMSIGGLGGGMGGGAPSGGRPDGF